jgi:type II secretory pathway component GspD/PulD (secretin)
MVRLLIVESIVACLLCSHAIAQQSANDHSPFNQLVQEGRRQSVDPFGHASNAKRDVVQKQDAVADIAAAEQRIRHELKQLTSIKAIELPLSDVVQEISVQHNLPIVIDNRSLEEIGLSAEVPVNLYLEGVSLRSALRLLLRSHNLTYVVKDEVLQITSTECAERNLVVRVFRIPDSITANPDEFVKLMKASVESNIWDSLGGPCTAYAVGDLLIVSATENGLETVEDFLTQIANADVP